ncbi:MAG TPA: phosphoribosyltransferase family protein [Pyrinomonadaceae bacterium]
MVDRAAPASSHNHAAAANRLFRFPDLRTAGALLAEKLRDRDLSNALVLGIALGGVPVAHVVAAEYHLPFDLVLIKRLLLPKEPGPALCAVSAGGIIVLDDEIALPTHPSEPIEHFLVDAVKQLRDRENVCRAGHPAIDVADRPVVLVDCAIHTGSTMQIAIRALRKLKPARIISAVPVASRDGQALIEQIADETVTLAQPEPFGHAGMWYEDFSRPPDEELVNLLDSAQKVDA